jgi:four helix bundle protein
MKSYRDLIVWQKSMSWVTMVYTLSSKIPESEKFGLISQIRRSSVSIPSNIAEGYGRNYKKDYSRFLQISRGSLFECQTQIEMAINLGFISREDCKEINDFSTEIEKMLNSLINKLSEK